MTVVVSHNCDEVWETRLRNLLTAHPMGGLVNVIGSEKLKKGEVLIVSEDEVERIGWDAVFDKARKWMGPNPLGTSTS